jgi:hypothetical protein
MRRFAQRPGPARAAEIAVRSLLVVLISAAGIAACGDSSTSPPTTAEGSAIPAASRSTAAPVPSPTLGAASPTPAPSGAGGSFDTCALLVAADVSKILGGGEVQAKPMPSGGWVAGQCAWNGPTSGFFLGVGTAASIAAFGDPAAADAKARLARFKSGAGTPKDVAGIGDGAAVSPSGIAAYRGGTYLEITNLGLTEDQLVEIMKLAVVKA